MPRVQAHTPNRCEYDEAAITAIDFLKSRGFKLTREFAWIGPGRTLTDEEVSAVDYLVLEWDYDGLTSGYSIIK